MPDHSKDRFWENRHNGNGNGKPHASADQILPDEIDQTMDAVNVAVIKKSPQVATVDVLVSTCNHLPALIMTLSGVAAQTLRDLHLIVSDQSTESLEDRPVIRTLRRVIEARGGSVEWHHHERSKGKAAEYAFLLTRAMADMVLFLDDDVLMESWVLERLVKTLRRDGCGFVGAHPTALSYRGEHRAHQQAVDFWNGMVHPEVLTSESPQWNRRQLHRAANLWHAGQTISPGEFRRYKVAWITSCVLYHRPKLIEMGGFTFWADMARSCLEQEILLQNLLMRRWGGCGLVPSGTCYAEVPSAEDRDAESFDRHSLNVLLDMIERLGPKTIAEGSNGERSALRQLVHETLVK